MKTLNKIEAEVVGLLRIKPLDQIKVQEICRNLKISRTTFYVYFESTTTLIQDLSNSILDDIAELFSQWQYLNFSQMLMLSSDRRTFQSIPIYQAYCYIWQRKEFFQALIGPYAPKYFSKNSYLLLVKMLTYLVEQNNPKTSNQLIYFCSGGIWNSLDHWVNYDTEDILPSEIARQDLNFLSQLLLGEANALKSRS